MKAEIRRAGESARAGWNAFVAKHSAASPYHRFEWADAVAAAYGHPAQRLYALRGGRVVGILPLVAMRSPFDGGRLVSLPFCDVGGPLCQDAEVERGLVEKAAALGRRLGAKQVELRMSAPLESVPAGFGASVHSHKVRMVMDLPPSSDELMASFKSKLRSQIRRAERNGVEFRRGTPGQVDRFYEVFCTNMRDLGSPVHARGWFEEVLRSYRENAALALVCFEDKPIGGGILLFNGGGASIPWASTLRSHNHLAPNMLLYWGLLKLACDRGCRTFDFGRSTPEEGTYRFKAQWGARPAPLHWATLAAGDSGVVFEASNPSRLRETAADLWKRLPLPVANCLGPYLRRHVSL
jgi:FemAB-related protein (PEP-CTERM system-associated)